VTEILFYHLENQPLEGVLPVLLEKTLERGWKAVVEVGSRERAASLDSALWTFRDDSFLPHGLAGGDTDALQPVLITTGSGNPNGANVRFYVDGAVPGDVAAYTRVVFLFSGHDPEAIAEARAAWKALSSAGGHEITYWQQDANGRWVKKA
jgi:DNA polymerase-3 subunit chi